MNPIFGDALLSYVSLLIVVIILVCAALNIQVLRTGDWKHLYRAAVVGVAIVVLFIYFPSYEEANRVYQDVFRCADCQVDEVCLSRFYGDDERAGWPELSPARTCIDDPALVDKVMTALSEGNPTRVRHHANEWVCRITIDLAERSHSVFVEKTDHHGVLVQVRSVGRATFRCDGLAEILEEFAHRKE